MMKAELPEMAFVGRAIGTTMMGTNVAIIVCLNHRNCLGGFKMILKRYFTMKLYNGL
jgi:hypothetical protein